MAPLRISALVPALAELSTLPGTAKTGAALLGGMAGGDQGSAALGRLDDDHAAAQAADDAVAGGEHAGHRLHPMAASLTKAPEACTSWARSACSGG